MRNLPVTSFSILRSPMFPEYQMLCQIQYRKVTRYVSSSSTFCLFGWPKAPKQSSYIKLTFCRPSQAFAGRPPGKVSLLFCAAKRSAPRAKRCAMASLLIFDLWARLLCPIVFRVGFATSPPFFQEKETNKGLNMPKPMQKRSVCKS